MTIGPYWEHCHHLLEKDFSDLTQLLIDRAIPTADRDYIDAIIIAKFGYIKAIMFTDLVGFSSSVRKFGIVHFLQIIQESEAIFIPIIEKYNGECLKREGDSLLAVFNLPLDALEAAVALVESTNEINVSRKSEDKIKICIGLGFGVVLRIGESEVWGEEVNSASRLGEDIAEGGEILATAAFRAEIPNEPFKQHDTLLGILPIFKYVK